MKIRDHLPSHVQGPAVTPQGADVESVVQALTPQVMWNHGRQNEAEQKNQWQVISG